jgi:acyl-CoA thioesterase FadM
LLFDYPFRMVVHTAGRPISRSAFLHVDYRKVTPTDTPLTVRGWVDSVEGRKSFVSSELTDSDGVLLAEAHDLMVRLLASQP